MFDKIVSSIGRFSYRHRNIIVTLGIILFVAVIILESLVVVEYSYAEESIVSDIFPQDDTLVIVYDNADEKRISPIIQKLSRDENITSIQAYDNTLGAKLSPDEISAQFGIDSVFVNTLFYIYEYGMETSGMTFTDFATFISSDDFLNNETFSSMIDQSYKADIKMLGALVEGINSDKKYTANQISDMFGVDPKLVKGMFYIKQLENLTFGNFAGTLLGTVADIFGMDPDRIEQIFGINPVESMSIGEFVSTISNIYTIFGGIIDNEQSAQIDALLEIYRIVKNDIELTPEDISDLLSSFGESDMLNESNINLLYILSHSNTMNMSRKKVPLYDFVIFLSDEITTNDAFSSFIEPEMADMLSEAKTMMQDGKKQLVGPEHSRMIITLSYVPESKEMMAFYDELSELLDSSLTRDYYLVGNSAMSYEVSQTFDTEYLIISIVTAISVFIVVYFTFRKLSISILLIAVIECAVFAMMSVMAITNSPIFFIALILVQCIIMGSMIDYAILFTSYYREVRLEYRIEDALPETMKKATYAILTSSLIMVLVTFTCGLFMTGMVAAILRTLSIGSFSAILLILFVLPSLLVIFDKTIMKNTNAK